MRCKTCSHRDRAIIDEQIIGGGSLRSISAAFNISLGALHRHKACIKEALAGAMRDQQDERGEHADDLLLRVRKLADEAIGILETAKATGNLKAATSAIVAAVRTLELCGRLDGSLAMPHAPGIHLTMNRVTNNTVINYDNDVEFAAMIAEATEQFNPDVIEKMKALACN